jgi:hypothetical protein
VIKAIIINRHLQKPETRTDIPTVHILNSTDLVQIFVTFQKKGSHVQGKFCLDDTKIFVVGIPIYFSIMSDGVRVLPVFCFN